MSGKFNIAEHESKVSTAAGTNAVSFRQHLPSRAAISDALATPTGRLVPIVVSIAVIWGIFAAKSPIFFSAENFTNLANQISVTILISLALVFVLLVRQIDLSLAVLAATCGGVAAVLTVTYHWNEAVAIVVCLAFGAAVGASSAVVATFFSVPTFIVTLGGYFILSAVLLWLIPATGVIAIADTPLENVAGTYIGGWPSYFVVAAAVIFFGVLRWDRHRSMQRVGAPSSALRSVVLPIVVLAAAAFCFLAFAFDADRGVPLPFLIAVGLVAVFSYVANQTPFGRRIYAIGGSPEGARRAGIPVRQFTIVIFALSGAFTALAGIVLASQQLGVSAQTSDFTILLQSLAAVVIGGVSLFGGVGSVWAALMGSLVIGSISNGLYLINASTQVRWSIEGVILVLAVVIDSLIRRKASTANTS